MAQATFDVLGPVRVRLADGAQIRLGGKPRAVLATLLLHANTVVSRERLVSSLWDDPPASAISNAQTYVAQLRRLLPASARLLTQGAGYLFEATAAQLDLLAFDLLVRQARAALERGDLDTADQRFQQALGLWRGRPAEDTPLAGPIRGRIAELEERRADTRSDWADTRLALGMHAELIGELRAFTADEPMRERSWQQLMLALSRSGRRAEALEAFHQARSALVTELGIEPGRELQRLQAAILAGERSVSEPEPWSRICQLPADIADFVGRNEELAVLSGVSQPKVLPITVIMGPPGVGKSTLAVHAAHLLRPRFPDGQLYLRLGGASPTPRDPGALLAELLRGLHVEGALIPDSMEERAAMYRSMVADRAVLVVLDDAADADQVRPLLPGTSRSAVLVTSRGPLTALPGVATIGLGVPSEPEARALLESIAGDARVRAEPDAARAILQACGNLPLAIRIAGARLATRPAWPLGDLAARLSEAEAPLSELALAGLDVRTSFAMSYEGLNESAARAFRLIGLAGLESVADWSVAAMLGLPQREAEAAMEALALAGLVTADEVDPSGQPRYRMHDLLRAYARERAEAEGDEPGLCGFVTECLNRVRASVLEFPPPAIPPMGEPEPRSAALGEAWLLAERETLTTAVGLATPPVAAELVFRLTPFMVVHGFHDVASALLNAVGARAPDNRTAMLGRLLLADIALERRRPVMARHVLRGLHHYFEQAGDLHASAYALTGLATCHLLSGEYDAALTQVRVAIAWLEGAGDTNGLLNALTTELGVHLYRGEHEETIQVCRRALELTGERRYGDYAVRFLRSLGLTRYEMGEVEEAIEHYEVALRLSRDLGWGPGERMTLRRLGEAYGALGRFDAAESALSRSAELFARAGDVNGEALAAYSFGEISLRRERPQEALRHLTRCLDRMDEQMEPLWRARALREIGRAHEGLGDLAAARDAWRASLALLRRISPEEAAALEGLLD